MLGHSVRLVLQIDIHTDKTWDRDQRMAVGVGWHWWLYSITYQEKF